MAFADVPWIVWVIVLPLAGATVAFIVGERIARLAASVSIAIGGVVAGLTFQVWRYGAQRYPVGGWGAPLGIDLYADGLSVLMLLMTAAIGISVSVYAVGYFAGHAAGSNERSTGQPREYFWPLWLFLWAALNALFLSGDLFNLYVTLELTTLSAVGLVTLAGGATAITAALRYLLAALVGSLLYLLGVAVAYASSGTLDVATLGRAMGAAPAPVTALALIAVGSALKAALFPLHFWLPPAHVSAPAPVSAVLSGLVVTASFYLLFRLWFDAFPAVVSVDGGRLLALLGSAAIVWGSVQALIARRLKMLIAYSTVAQLGYLFLVFALASPGDRSAAWPGAALFAVSHGCAKAAMFLAAGSILHVASHDRIADLGGIGRRLPATFFGMALSSVTLMGLPPSGAFVAKWMLIEAALETGQAWLAVVIVAGGLLAAAYLFPVLGQAFSSADTDVPARVPRTMEGTTLALALIALVLGLFTAPALDLLRIGAPDARQAALELER